MLFHLVIHKDENSAYGVTVPALAGCFSAGDTFEEAIDNAKEGIEFHLQGLLEDNQEPVFQSATLEALQQDKENEGAIFAAVDIDVSAFTLKPERFNVSWPRYLLKEVDKHVVQTNDNRSNFLAKAALKALQSE